MDEEQEFKVGDLVKWRKDDYILMDDLFGIVTSTDVRKNDTPSWMTILVFWLDDIQKEHLEDPLNLSLVARAA